MYNFIICPDHQFSDFWLKIFDPDLKFINHAINSRSYPNIVQFTDNFDRIYMYLHVYDHQDYEH